MSADTTGARPEARAGFVLFAALLVVAACAPRGAPAVHAHRVVMHGVRFDPETLAVSVGDTVTWTNHDIVAHTSTAADGRWNSGTIAPESSWTAVIGHAGALPYACGFHPTMKGLVTAR